jgi:hypothetical protein
LVQLGFLVLLVAVDLVEDVVGVGVGVAVVVVVAVAVG